jgi:hypothetical protein
LYLREEQNIIPFTFSRLRTDISYTDYKTDSSAGLGLFYNDLVPKLIETRVSASFWLTKKWRFIISQIGNIDSTGDTTKINPMEQKIDVYRDLHCWETWVSYSKRGDIEQYYFNIGLKLSNIGKKQTGITDVEKQFYPWR